MSAPDEFARVMFMMEAAHQTIHELEQDFDDTLLISMTERDTLLVGLALACLWFDYPCLNADSRDMQQRIVELAQVQKPDWMVQKGDTDGQD